MLPDLQPQSDAEIPGFNLHTSLQANVAFLVATFMFFCSVAWALRDHRRRLLEIASEEQEDILYLTVLGIFAIVAALGSYFAFNRAGVDATGRYSSSNVLVDELFRGFREMTQEKAATHVPYTPDLDVRLPIPTSAQLAQETRRHRDPSSEYGWMSGVLFVLIILFAVWYFYPQQRQSIAPPPSYHSHYSVGEQNQPSSPFVTGGEGGGQQGQQQQQQQQGQVGHSDAPRHSDDERERKFSPISTHEQHN